MGTPMAWIVNSLQLLEVEGWGVAYSDSLREALPKSSNGIDLMVPEEGDVLYSYDQLQHR